MYQDRLIMLLQHIFNTIISFLLLTRGSGGAKPCISIDVRGHCYQIVDTNTTWATASRICKENDGHLIFIETAEEQQVISGQMQKRNFTADALWIGSANVHSEDGPRWENGESFTYVNWAKGEPNNPREEETCAEIRTYDFKWNDKSCTLHKGYICEKTDDFNTCTTVGNIRHCYQIVQDEITWLQAFKSCSQIGGMLVTIESIAEQQFIEDQMQNKTFTVEGLWIGANKLHPENQRTWANGHRFTYANWAKGEPNNKPYVENCTVISTSDFTWNDQRCSNQKGYICELPLTTGSGGFKPCISIGFRGHCYQIVDTNTTWATASRICKENDGHLIFIETEEEQQFIADQMQKRNFTAGALWIGSANVHAEEGPRWDNGESFTYVNWAKGEPSNPPGEENCAEIYTKDFEWNDNTCKRRKGYICEKRDAIEPCRTVGNIRHCYQIVQDEITWLQAFKICSQDRGMLVTIESEAEQMFLEDQIQNKNFTVAGLWIGANKLHPENQRVWINGHQFTYVNWAQGAPNNRQYVENCVEISTSDFTWNDEMCSTQRGYVCECQRTSDLQIWVIIVPVVSALILLVGVVLLCCFLKRRRKKQKKKVEVYQDLQDMEMRKAEHIYD